MKLKYFFISVLILLVASCTPTPMYAQWLVTDPSSITQRLTLFLEELSEAMQERYTMEKQTDNTSELVKQNDESLKKHIPTLSEDLIKKVIKSVGMRVKSKEITQFIMNGYNLIEK